MPTKHTDERKTRTSQGPAKQPRPKSKGEPRKAASRAGMPEPAEPAERPPGKSEHGKPNTSSK